MRVPVHSEDARLVRREEKEENNQRLIGQYLDRLSVKDDARDADRRITIVARSPQSPVARSLLMHTRQIQELNVVVDLVFAKLEPIDSFAEWAELVIAFLAKPTDTAKINVRWLRREALLEAHEQMSLGTAFAWWGDCMRREPENRDSFEVTSRFDTDANGRSVRAFEALWMTAETAPLGRRSGNLSAMRLEGEVAGPLDMANLGAGELPTQGNAIIATRH